MTYEMQINDLNIPVLSFNIPFGFISQHFSSSSLSACFTKTSRDIFVISKREQLTPAVVG